MPKKVVISPQWVLWSIPMLHWRVGLLTALVLVGMVVIWSIDGCTIKSIIQVWRYQQDYFAVRFHTPNLTLVSPYSPVNFTLYEKPGNKSLLLERHTSWISSELEPNFTSNLIARWSARGGVPCKDSKAVEIAVPGLDGGEVIELSAGDVHEFGFQALDDSGNPRCLGGDYFEADLSGESWKSRPLVKDFSNGSYSILVQVHPDFDGVYNLTIILLYRHFEGLKFTPWRFSYDRMLRNVAIRFYKISVQLPELQACKASDFGRDVWSGRWTRHGKNDDCAIGNDGRYRCLGSDFPCKAPWCDGSLGILESNGWVYSTHCSFKLYSAESAWNCLKNRWIFFWGDSNHVDTIRAGRGFSGQITNLKTVPRKCSRSVFRVTYLKFTTRTRELPLKCIGLGALVDFDGATTSKLVPVVDQMLLMGSIFLTYMAGVIPVERSHASYRKTNSDKNVFPESSDISGSSAKQNYGLESKYVLNVVRGKILNSLNALEDKAYSGDIILQSAKKPLSLSAVARGPKLRLLWAAFQQVEEEVNNIISISRAVGMDGLFGRFSEIIQRSCHPICAAWLEKEFFLLKGNADKELASMILEKVKGDNTVVESIARSGKKDLYSELLWYLTFDSPREDCYYDSCIFAVHGISILEDLVVALADGVASIYLEFNSVDSDVSSKTNSLDMSLCALSTRELQKLRNEVALNQWLCHNMDTVVSMYEDRFDLCTLESKPIDLTDSIQIEEQNWWKKLTQQNSKTTSPELHCIEISHFSMPVKRTKELRALTGWRYSFSLFLELSDITMPIIRAVIDKVSDAISFFLVSLIGRSLGLIYTGIRQSLKWK